MSNKKLNLTGLTFAFLLLLSSTILEKNLWAMSWTRGRTLKIQVEMCVNSASKITLAGEQLVIETYPTSTSVIAEKPGDNGKCSEFEHSIFKNTIITITEYPSDFYPSPSGLNYYPVLHNDHKWQLKADLNSGTAYWQLVFDLGEIIPNFGNQIFDYSSYKLSDLSENLIACGVACVQTPEQTDDDPKILKLGFTYNYRIIIDN